MAQMKKAAVSGKTVKTTTYSLLNPFKKDVKMVNERTTRKPVAKRQQQKSQPSAFGYSYLKPSSQASKAPLGTPPAKAKGSSSCT
jgi:hypothetical protein